MERENEAPAELVSLANLTRLYLQTCIKLMKNSQKQMYVRASKTPLG